MTAKRQADNVKLRAIHHSTGATMSMDDTRHRPGRLADRVRESRQRDVIPMGAIRLADRFGGDVHIYRATFAGPDADLAAHTFQAWREQAGTNDPDLFGTDVLDATFTDSIGAGAWGVERGVTMEAATPKAHSMLALVVQFLRCWSQECAYVTVDGRHAYEIASDGAVTPITGKEV